VKKKSIVGLAAIVVIIATFLVGVIGFGPGSGEIKELEGVEVREYKGENLSSINDFRENSIKGPQHVDIENYQLKITGLVEKPVSSAYDEVISDYKNYQKVVRLDCVEGWAVNLLWEGVLVKDLLEQAKPLPEAKVVIFHAYDGYTTSFPIEYVMENDIQDERGYPAAGEGLPLPAGRRKQVGLQMDKVDNGNRAVR